MAFTTTIDTVNELQTEFKAHNRDNYSHDAYQVLIDLSEECDGMELDVIALDCEWTEQTIKEIVDDYGHLLSVPLAALKVGTTDEELFSLVSELLDDNTYGVATQNNTHFMYQQF